MAILTKRRRQFTDRAIRQHKALRAFHAPQREHPAKVQHPKPSR